MVNFGVFQNGDFGSQVKPTEKPMVRKSPKNSELFIPGISAHMVTWQFLGPVGDPFENGVFWTISEWVFFILAKTPEKSNGQSLGSYEFPVYSKYF